MIMRSYLLFLCIALSAFSFSGCDKTDDNCDCVNLPDSPTKWKITSRTGGVSGTSVPLTTDQQNNILTLQLNGKYVCTNTQTGMIVNGTFAISDFSSIYGTKQKFVFDPQLPMLDDEYYILLSNAEGKLVFGDNRADGYSTTFSIIQP
jgi:hypothetical protein